MKKIILILILSGCAKPAPVNFIAHGAEKAVVALEKSLAPECRTESIIAQIDALKTHISSIKSACDSEVLSIKNEKDKYQWAFVAVIIFCLILCKKLI